MDNPLDSAKLDSLKDALKPSGGGSAFKLTGRSLFLMALAGFGLFVAYVLFIRQKTNAANTSGLAAIAADQAAAPGIATNQAALPDSQIAALKAEIATNQASTVAYLSSIADNAAGARTDASITLNGVNDLLGNHGTSHNLVPPPVPVTTTKIVPPPGKFVAGPVLPMTGTTTTTHAYLSSVGLGHP